MARTESRSRHSKEAAMGERIWTAKLTCLTHLERRITEENRAQIYSWHEQKTKERESGRRSFKMPCLKTWIDSLLEGAKKFLRVTVPPAENRTWSDRHLSRNDRSTRVSAGRWWCGDTEQSVMHLYAKCRKWRTPRFGS